DTGDLAPNALLKSSACQTKRDREAFPLSVEVFLQFLLGLLKNRVSSIERPTLAYCWHVLAPGKAEAGQGRLVGSQHELADGGFEEGIISCGHRRRSL